MKFTPVAKVVTAVGVGFAQVPAYRARLISENEADFSGYRDLLRLAPAVDPIEDHLLLHRL